MSSRHPRRLVAVSALASLLLTAAPAAALAQNGADPDRAGAAPYVVILEQAPVVAPDGAEPGIAAAAEPGERVDRSSPEVRTYVADLEREQDRALAGAGIAGSAKRETFTYALNGFSAALTGEQAARLEQQPGVALVARDHLRQLHTETSPGYLGLDTRRGPWESGYTGDGVVLGVIDTGIWPEHPSFADDGTYPQPDPEWMGGEVACEFGDTAHNPDDAPFDCNNKLIGARDMRILYKEFVDPEVYNSARDYNGHGTHTASTAGGNQDVQAEIFDIPRGTVSGIAPRAQIAAYSACGDQGCFGGDLAGAIDEAVADGVDVINYSIGGGPTLTGPDDLAMLFANDAGVFVATSAGNDGPGAGTVGSPATDPWVLGVGASTHDRTFEGTVTLGDDSAFTGASVTDGTGELPLVDAADHGNELCDPAETFQPEITGTIVLCARGDVARVAKSQAVFEQGGAGTVLYNENDAQAQVTDNHFVPTVNTNFSDGQAIKEYIDTTGADAVATIGGGEAVPTQDSVMADFSSRGPNAVAESIIKPDVTAPGVNILAGNTPTPTLDAPGQLFQSISGTSMASPHAAGVLVLLKQAHPDWTAAMAHSALMTTARTDVSKEDGATAADPFDIGSGHIDPSGKPKKRGSVFNPGLVYDAGLDEYLGFLCDGAPEVFADPEATCAALADAGVPVTMADLNYPSIAVGDVAGDVEVQRTITSVADRRVNWRAKVNAPDGFDVTVEPRRVTLDPGESATVTIEIANVSAPLDQWRFGSLSWRGRGYQAQSPIALKGTALRAPAEVGGSGTEGGLDFALGFGYTGDYTAAALGLVAPAGIDGTVGQDPDQTFDPDDPEGTTAHEITVSDSAQLRLSLTTEDLDPADPDIDLDVFLYNSAGEEVDSSTAGGTAEEIDLRLPADDTYTLYVHGWQTLGLSVDYTVASWLVPLEPDAGTLELVSAPDQAELGANGTVEVAWGGLDPGPEYLGAVSHTGPDGLLGLTLVTVGTG